ncbi:MAG: HNH endonuclease [Clostridiales bacterium]|nr:HNH endonuclease [Clostridiales bacterium]
MQQGIYTPGEIVHHKVQHVTVDNVDNPEVTLSFANLELLCRKCHAEEHEEMYGHDRRRYAIVDGRVVTR